MVWASASAVAGLLFISGAASYPFEFSGGVVRRAKDVSSSYDYIVVGGGTSGLTVANRLSEDKNVSVLVVEAGSFDHGESFFSVPAEAGGAVGTKYDWNVTTVKNPLTNNRTVGLPIGKVVGGSSMLNRMVFDRGSRADYDAWRDLGNPGWGFDDLLPYFIKSETFTPPSETNPYYDIQYEPSAHGTSGPIHSSFARWIWPSVKNFHAALTGLGISSSKDGAAGDAFGFYWGPSAERPSDETRSSARIGYYDSASNRTNLQLIAEQQVTRLIFSNCSTGIHVDGVAFRASASAAEQIVSANKEVILAAGSIHTPQLLQLSGIGDFSSLAKVQPNLKVDLPGVGNNFQDHQFVTLVYNFSNNSLSSANMTENSTFAAQAAANYSQSATGPLTYNSASAFAFLPLANYSNSSSQILGEANSTPSAAHLDNSTPAAVVAGYKAQRELVLEALSSATSASMEYIWSDAGLSVAIVKPLSRGSVQIATLNPFVQPLVNWRALTDPTDLEMLDAGVGFARLLMTQPETAILGPTEVVPGLATDAQTFIRSQLTTVYHPAGTCSMLARELGGVVDARLKVYGTDNLRVVDASIFPILPATHTQTSVYAVAEKASDLIKEDNQSS